MAQIKLDMSDKPTPESKVVSWWLSEINTADKREESWMKKARECVQIYETESKSENDFNILYSNTETLAPALYNNTPTPVVQRRYKDNDPTGKAAAMVMKRALIYEQDSNLDDSYTFDDSIESAVMDALVPGRGLTRFKIEEKANKAYVCREAVPWERFKHGFGRTWPKVPWVGFLHYFNRKEMAKQFPSFSDKVEYEEREVVDRSKETDDGGNAKYKDRTNVGKVKVAAVWEIWDKRTKKVIFFAPTYKDKPLKEVEDPLKLAGFFPCPKPLMFYKRISGMVPQTIYSTYEEQAKELNRVSFRINKIVDMMKVRGFYDSTLMALSTLMELDDGQFQPLDNVASFKNGDGAIPDAFWFMPIQELVGVLQQLYAAREATKAVIYEITGISDILRGSSVASETATAQGIKDKWGSLRIKKWQKTVGVYARDCLRLMAELTAEHLGSAELKEMTLVQLPMDAERKQAQQQLQEIQVKAQTPDPMTGESPAPPPPGLIQGLQKAAKATTWEDVEKLLKSEIRRSYHIDVETNSTLDFEASEDKQLIAEFMNAMAQFLNGVGPLVEKGAIKADAANAILGAIARRFRFGDEVEEYLQISDDQGADAKMQEMQEKLDETTKAAEESAKKADELTKQLEMQKWKESAQQQVAKVTEKASESTMLMKVELMIERSQSKMKDMLHAAELTDTKVSLNDLTRLHNELMKSLTTLAPQEPTGESLQ